MRKDVLFSVEEAAERANVRPASIRLWCDAGAFKPVEVSRNLITDLPAYFFSERDITRLIKFADDLGEREKPKREFADDHKQEYFNVSEIAALWGLSDDSVRRLFENESGVLTLGQKNPRGKRKRVTLRIPRAVMERVKKRRSNPT